MWSRLKSLNPVKHSASTETSQRQDGNVPEEVHQPFGQEQYNKSNISISSVASSFTKQSGRSLFRRSKLPVEFPSQPPPSSISSQDARPRAPSGTARMALSNVPEVPATPQESAPQHAKTSSGGSGSVRSIMRGPKTSGSGQSVRFNQRDAFRIITPNTSASTVSGVGEEEDSRSFLRRLRESNSNHGVDDDDDKGNNKEEAGTPPLYPSLLEEDPFAANPSITANTDVNSPTEMDAIMSFNSTSSSDLPSFPSDMDNLFDMTNEIDSIAMTDSLLDLATFRGAPAPHAPIPSPELSRDYTFPNVAQMQTPKPMDPPIPEEDEPPPAAQSDSPSPSSTSEGATALYQTPQHNRMPSEAPTIRPSPSSLHSDSSYRTGNASTASPASDSMSQTPDATVYHTPRTTNSPNAQGVSLVNYPGQRRLRQIPDPHAEMPPFLIPDPEDDEKDEGTEVSHDYSPEALHARHLSIADNSAFIVPNNSMAISLPPPATSSMPLDRSPPAEAIVVQHELITHLRSRLTLLESISSQYEQDLSARDSLVHQLSSQITSADQEVVAWRTEAERTTRKFDRMRSKVSSLAETCNKLATERAKLVRDRESLAIDRDSFNAERKRTSMYDTASSVALQQLHSRVSSLDAGRVLLQEQLDAAERAAQLSAQEKEQAVISRNEAMQAKDDAVEAWAACDKARQEAEKEATKWKERVEVMEMESAQAADLLNSFHFTPAKGRSAASSRVQSTYSAANRPLSTITMQGQYPFLVNDGAEQVHILKSEIIRREQEYEELRETQRSSSFKWAEERNLLMSERETLAVEYEDLQGEHDQLRKELEGLRAEQDTTVEHDTLQKEYNTLTREHDVLQAELEAQWARAEKASDEIHNLRQGRKGAELEVARLSDVERLFATRTQEWAVKEEGLLADIEHAQQRIDELSYEKDEILAELDAERRRNHEVLEATSQLASASSEIESLNTSLDAERAHSAESKTRLQELEARISAHGAQVAEWRIQETTLLAELQGIKENAQQLQWNREKILEELQHERAHHDQLSAEMKQKLEEANRNRDTFAEGERRLKDLVRSLETEISHVSAGLMDRDRECERLENQLKNAKAEIGRLHADNERFMRSSSAEDNEQRLELDGLRAKIDAVNDSRANAEAALETSRARSEEMGVELERLRRQLRDVKQQSADLEVKHIRLGKEKKQLEDDNAGLYIGLEAKQEELELIKRKLGVRGTAGATPAPSATKELADDHYPILKPPALRRSSVTFSATGESDEGTSKIPVPSLSKQSRPSAALAPGQNRLVAATKGLRPRVSMATPTPAGPISRYPSLGHVRNVSSVSSIASSAGAAVTTAAHRPVGAPALGSKPSTQMQPPNETESIASSSAPVPPSASGGKQESGTISVRAVRRSSSISGNIDLPTMMNKAPPRRLPPRSSSSLGVTVEERVNAIIANKENRYPPAVDGESTPKAVPARGIVGAARRKVMVQS